MPCVKEQRQIDILKIKFYLITDDQTQKINQYFTWYYQGISICAVYNTVLNILPHQMNILYNYRKYLTFLISITI